MPQRPLEKPLRVDVISVSGQNDRDAPWLLPETRSALLQNLIVRKNGERTRRNGVSSIGARSDDPFGMWRAIDDTLTQEALFTVYSGQIYIVPGAGVVDERASDFSLTDMLHMGVEGRYNGRLCTYVCSAQPDDSDPSLATLIGVITDNNQVTQRSSDIDSVAPRCAGWFQGRLWVADNTLAENNETLWWSELDDGTLYSPFNSLIPEPGIGGRITAVQPLRGFNPSLLVFKKEAIATVEPRWGSDGLIPQAADALDTSNTNIRLITANIGCVATKSVQFMPGAPGGDVWFLARDGVRAVSRATDDTVSGVTPPLTDEIDGTIKRINYAFAHKAVSAFHDSTYYLAVPLDGATENTHVLSFDMTKPGWRVDTWAPKDMVSARTTESIDRFWMQYNEATGDCSNSGVFDGYHVFKGYTGLLDPSGVPVVYQEDTKAWTHGTISDKKIWDSLTMVFKNEATETCVMALLYNVDNMGWNTFASAVFGGSPNDPVLGETPLPWGTTAGVTRTFQFSLADTPPGYHIQIRYAGQSDLAVPTVFDLAVSARPVHMEFDNSIA